MKIDQSVELRKESVQQLWLHVQIVGHPLTEHLLDHLQQLTMVLLSDDELVDVLLSLGFVRLQGGCNSFRNSGRPSLRLLSLNPQEGICVKIAETNGEAVRKFLGRQKLRVQKVLPVTINLLSLLSGFARNIS